MRAGANLPAVGGYNQTVILDVIRRAPSGISRVEVAERTGLSAQTASNVCRRLLEAGLIVETGTHSAGVGKPRTIIKLNPRSRFAIGVHLDPSVITVVLLDLAGSVVAHRTIQASESDQPMDAIEDIVQATAGVIEDAGVDQKLVMGVGVAAPGPVDVISGTVLNPPLLAGWRDVPIRDQLAQRLGTSVLLEKDVTAAAVAELWTHTGAERGNMAFFYYGTGVGVGLVVQNEVIRGFSSNAGDVGQLVVAGSPAAARWRLGDAVMPRNLVIEAIARGVLPRQPRGMRLGMAQVRALFRDLSDLALAGEPTALEIMEAVAADIANGLIAVINLLDVRHIVFGGPFWWAASELLRDRIESSVLNSETLVPPHPIAFLDSSVGQDVAAVGAACLVLDDTFSPRPAGLLIRQHSS